jgi:2',3'-cyclic-nucleotide 2'-phosphodiesterase (5'-nucleotidase family)
VALEMVKLKKYNQFFKLFVIIITTLTIYSCGSSRFQLTTIEGKKIPITASAGTNETIDKFVQPYRETIDTDLSAVLAYNPETLDKNNGKWQSPLGNLMADVTLKAGEKIFKSRENKSIAICILNSGGIRSTLAKGNVTARTAYGIMPFENSLVVIALKGEQIQELVDYFIATKKSHPLSGLTFTIAKDKSAKNILVQGQALDKNAIYYVATNDYLANGGDNMNFFKKGIQLYDLDYKLRNILIDYFKEVDTIPVINDIRITEE